MCTNCILAKAPAHHLTSKGYLRIHQARDRNMYLHRWVVRELLEAEQLPEGFEVHHIDYNRRNNCPMNLVLMEGRIHWALAKQSRGFGGRFMSGVNAEVDRLVVEDVAREMEWPIRWVGKGMKHANGD